MDTTHHRTSLALILVLTLSALACDEDSCDLYDSDCVAAEGEAETNDSSTETCEDGSGQQIIDASEAGAWVHFDLDGCAEVEGDESWELRLQRFNIAINGGVSGDAGLEAAWIEGVSLDEVDSLPADLEWASDEPDADDDGEDELVFGDWYDYDVATHVLSPKPRVYVIRSSEGAYFGVQIEGYYNDAGSSGHVALRWKALAG